MLLKFTYVPLDSNLVSKQNEKKRVDNHFLNPFYLPIQFEEIEPL